jgi:Protein of unknown function (DUF3617)
MRRLIVLGVVCISATVLLAQSKKNSKTAEPAKTAVTKAALMNVPLNVKTGLWQLTRTITWTGLPSQQQAMMNSMTPTTTYNSCVLPKDLKTNPWANGSEDKCTWTVLSSTGTDMEVQGTSCDLAKSYGMDTDIHGKIHVLDTEHGTGAMAITMTGNGQTMNGNATYTGKWIGATCPSDSQ